MGALFIGVVMAFPNGLAGLYQSNISIATMSLAEAAAIVGLGVFLGLFASWFTAARHMRRIEPR